jgi:hypothetical protein
MEEDDLPGFFAFGLRPRKHLRTKLPGARKIRESSVTAFCKVG